MVLYSKQEEWAMFDLDANHPVTKRVERGQAPFIDALCLQDQDPCKAAALAQESLQAAVDGSEELALSHSDILLKRRILSNALPKCPIGCGIGFELTHERLRAALMSNFDYIQLPTAWKALTPEEGDHDWKLMDNWVDWATRSRLPIIAGPIISFTSGNLPDWLYIWEHDYDTVRDLIYEHVERLVNRYKNKIKVWNVVSGLHVNSHFTFNFEQLMDLTRTTTMLVKKIQPAAKVVVELRQPFGEYYGTNQRSIPPMMYADLLVQSAISFDAFGIELMVGQAVSGQYTRDLMQVSSLLDQFAGLGKPLHLTLAAPSEPVTQMMITAPDSGEPVDPDCGFWRRPWSQVVQSHWLEAVFQIAMSKPFVDAVTWRDLCDYADVELPLSGLLSEQLQPKNAFLRLAMFRRRLNESDQKHEVQQVKAIDVS